MFCPNCGSEILSDAKFCVNCGQEVKKRYAENNSADTTESTNTETVQQVSEPASVENQSDVNQPVINQPVTNLPSENSDSSYFDGTGLGYIGWSILGSIVTILTFGICFPIARYWITKWETEHTVINGKRMVYKMGAGSYFGYYILSILLTIITFGIYGLFFPYFLKKKNLSKTFFEGETTPLKAVDNSSFFDGQLWKFIGMLVLCGTIVGCSCGILYPFAVIVMLRWESKHTVISDNRLHFDGSAWSLFGTWLLCVFFTIITFGIYSLWVPVRIKKWIVKRTVLLDSLPEEERVNLCSDKLKTSTKVFLALSFIFLSTYSCNFPLLIRNLSFNSNYVYGSVVVFLINLLLGTSISVLFVVSLGISLFTAKYDRFIKASKTALCLGGVMIGRVIASVINTVTTVGMIATAASGYFSYMITESFYFTNIGYLILSITGLVFMYIALGPVVKKENNNITLAGVILLSLAAGYYFNSPYGMLSAGPVYILRYIVLLACAIVAMICLIITDKKKASTAGYILIALLGVSLIAGILADVINFISQPYNRNNSFEIITMWISIIIKNAAIFGSVVVAFFGVLPLLCENEKTKTVLKTISAIVCGILFAAAIFVELVYPVVKDEISLPSFNFSKNSDSSYDYDYGSSSKSNNDYTYNYDDYSYNPDYDDIEWYNSAPDDGLREGIIMTNYENIRIRSRDSQNSDTVVILKKGSEVKIIAVGKQATIDGIKSNWVKVEVESIWDRDGDWIPSGTTGWCFAGYLK